LDAMEQDTLYRLKKFKTDRKTSGDPTARFA
jgi:hypothetical protein